MEGGGKKNTMCYNNKQHRTHWPVWRTCLQLGPLVAEPSLPFYFYFIFYSNTLWAPQGSTNDNNSNRVPIWISSPPSPSPVVLLPPRYLTNSASSPLRKSVQALPWRWLSALMTPTKLRGGSLKAPRTVCWCVAIIDTIRAFVWMFSKNIRHRLEL